MAKLAKEMDFLNPEGHDYRFRGDEPIDLESALQLMNEMQDIDELMGQIQDAERGGNAERIDKDLLQQLLGDDAVDDLDQLNEMLKALEDAGYIRSTDGDRWELTPRGSRMIGQKALGEIYAQLKRQNLGNHAVPEEGRFGERLEQTKAYEFGDPFHLHMPRTLRNAIDREGPHTPVRLKPEDFEIYRSEQITSAVFNQSTDGLLYGELLSGKVLSTNARMRELMDTNDEQGIADLLRAAYVRDDPSVTNKNTLAQLSGYMDKWLSRSSMTD